MAFLGDGPPQPSHGNWEFKDFRQPKKPKGSMRKWVVIAGMLAIGVVIKLLQVNGLIP